MAHSASTPACFIPPKGGYEALSPHPLKSPGEQRPVTRVGWDAETRDARQARTRSSGSTRQPACGSRRCWRARTCCGSGPAPASCSPLPSRPKRPQRWWGSPRVTPATFGSSRPLSCPMASMSSSRCQGRRVGGIFGGGGLNPDPHWEGKFSMWLGMPLRWWITGSSLEMSSAESPLHPCFVKIQGEKIRVGGNWVLPPVQCSSDPKFPWGTLILMGKSPHAELPPV